MSPTEQHVPFLSLLPPRGTRGQLWGCSGQKLGSLSCATALAAPAAGADCCSPTWASSQFPFLSLGNARGGKSRVCVGSPAKPWLILTFPVRTPAPCRLLQAAQPWRHQNSNAGAKNQFILKLLREYCEEWKGVLIFLFSPNSKKKKLLK